MSDEPYPCRGGCGGRVPFAAGWCLPCDPRWRKQQAHDRALAAACELVGRAWLAMMTATESAEEDATYEYSEACAALLALHRQGEGS